MDIFRSDLLSGHRALITGGGSGICHGIAQTFAVLGADVCLVGRKAERLETAAAAIRDSTGRRAIAAPADVRDPDQVGAAVAKAVDELGGLDTVVNGAAGNFLAPAAVISPNGFRTVVEIDLCGTFNVSRAAFEALKATERGLIINISATLQTKGTPMQAHAASAKAGIDALTKTLAVEWGPVGIRVNAIAPGPIGDTEGMRRLAPGDVAKRYVGKIPLRRFGRIDEIAHMAAYLRSEAGEYISGTVLTVDGGESCLGVGWSDLM